jgi:hypothetical protein
MTRRTLHVERLLGTKVVDAGGHAVGRIEELVVARANGDWCIVEVLLGPHGLLQRLAVSASTLPFLGVLERVAQPRRVPWRRLDLSDPAHPRLAADGTP